MGMRFRKSINLGGGAKLNLGKKSVGLSVGTKHNRVSINSKGRVTKSTSIPETGISFVKSSSIKGKQKAKNNKHNNLGSIKDDHILENDNILTENNIDDGFVEYKGKIYSNYDIENTKKNIKWFNVMIVIFSILAIFTSLFALALNNWWFFGILITFDVALILVRKEQLKFLTFVDLYRDYMKNPTEEIPPIKEKKRKALLVPASILAVVFGLNALVGGDNSTIEPEIPTNVSSAVETVAEFKENSLSEKLSNEDALATLNEALEEKEQEKANAKENNTENEVPAEKPQLEEKVENKVEDKVEDKVQKEEVQEVKEDIKEEISDNKAEKETSSKVNTVVPVPAPVPSKPVVVPQENIVENNTENNSEKEKEIIVYWAENSKKYHINPRCRTLKNGYVGSGTIDEAKAIGLEGPCGVCSKSLK